MLTKTEIVHYLFYLTHTVTHIYICMIYQQGLSGRFDKYFKL